MIAEIQKHLKTKLCKNVFKGSSRMLIANTPVVLDRKKEIEKRYAEEARCACSIFPQGELIPHERPDFLMHADSGTIGIEVTQLCLEESMKEAGNLTKIPKKAKALYTQLENSEPVDVSIAFSIQSSEMNSDDLTNSLVHFVHTHRERKESDFDIEDLPNGYCHIGIHSPLPRPDPTGRWYGARAFSAGITSEEWVASRIAKKNEKVSGYRITVPVIWLLIINDQFLGPGEVYVHPEDLACWKFDFDFDKVLLFCRELGAAGRVFELQRK